MEVILGTLAVVTPVLVVALGAVGWLYRHEKERREAVERQLSEHKYKAYVALQIILYDAVVAIKSGGEISSEIPSRLVEMNRELTLYGSDGVFKAYLNWFNFLRKLKATTLTEKQQNLLMSLTGHVVIAIRQDMGNPKTKITSQEVGVQLDLEFILAKGQK